MLNEVGYGQSGSELQLDLVYNPSGAYLPGDHRPGLKKNSKKSLKKGMASTLTISLRLPTYR